MELKRLRKNQIERIIADVHIDFVHEYYPEAYELAIKIQNKVIEINKEKHDGCRGYKKIKKSISKLRRLR